MRRFPKDDNIILDVSTLEASSYTSLKKAGLDEKKCKPNIRVWLVIEGICGRHIMMGLVRNKLLDEPNSFPWHSQILVAFFEPPKPVCWNSVQMIS